MNAEPQTKGHIISRIGASLIGSYSFVWGFASLGIVLGTASGMAYGEAQTLVFLLIFLVFLVCFCWAFVHASLLRVWSVLLGGGILMTGTAWVLAQGLG